MSLFDRFKKEKKHAAPAHKQKEKEPATLTVRQEQEAARKVSVTKLKKFATGIVAQRILLKPIVSEKSAHLHTLRQYVFKVSPQANKISVKKAIYEAYHEEPASVRIIRVQGKRVVRGTVRGQRSSYKKAIVMMPKGVTLPIYEGV
ncbi:MAG: 50S ribosomal protein L23 [Candidatus Komeilibacteria bacterium]|nr:50S ribosomal protein L23 [Candidatus Komeilibacteria bacterium]